MNSLKNIRQGKFFEIDIDENDQIKAEKKINEMCQKLLVNLIIEDYKINIIQGLNRLKGYDNNNQIIYKV